MKVINERPHSENGTPSEQEEPLSEADLTELQEALAELESNAWPSPTSVRLDELWGSAHIAVLVDATGELSSARSPVSEEMPAKEIYALLSTVARSWGGQIESGVGATCVLAVIPVGTGKASGEALPLDIAKVETVLEWFYSAVTVLAPSSRVYAAVARGPGTTTALSAAVTRVVAAAGEHRTSGLWLDSELAHYAPGALGKGIEDRQWRGFALAGSAPGKEPPDVARVAASIPGVAASTADPIQAEPKNVTFAAAASALFPSPARELPPSNRPSQGIRPPSRWGSRPMRWGVGMFAAAAGLILLIPRVLPRQGAPTTFDVEVGRHSRAGGEPAAGDPSSPDDLPLHQGDNIRAHTQVDASATVFLILQDRDSLQYLGADVPREPSTTGTREVTRFIKVVAPAGHLRVVFLASSALDDEGVGRATSEASEVFTEGAALCTDAACREAIWAAAPEALLHALGNDANKVALKTSRTYLMAADP